jgi:cell wall-associated NlpC family hydrolase
LWFSIKALLGVAEEVQDWKNERDNLEQIKVDLKSSLSEQQGVVDEAEAQRDEALNKASALESELNRLDESNADTGQYDEGRRADAEQLVAGLNALAEEGPLDSPESLPGGEVSSPPEEVSTFPQEAADAVGLQGLSPGDKQVLDNALTDTIQAGNAAQEAQRQQDEAARRVVRDLANNLASPPETQNTPLSKGERQNASLNKGEAQNAPLNKEEAQNAPLNKGGGAQTPSVPTVTDNRDLLNNARQFEAAKNNALQANQNALDKGLGLANALEQAQRPAAGTQTISAGKAAAGPNGAETSNVSAKPATGGGSGPAAVSLGMSKVGAGYELGSDGKNGKFSCTGLLRWIGAQLGYPDLPWDPSGWYSFPRRDGPAQPGDVVVTPGGVGMALGPDQLVMANEADQRVGTYPIDIMGPPTIVVPPWNK